MFSKKQRKDYTILRVSNTKIRILPKYVYEFGDPIHHMSMLRTVKIDENDEYIIGTGPSNLRFRIHVILDDLIFYPINNFSKHHIHDAYIRGRKTLKQLHGKRRKRMLRLMKTSWKLHRFLRTILGFFWGINCGFPLRDVALYTVWFHRGCDPFAIYERMIVKAGCKVGRQWIKTYTGRQVEVHKAGLK